eukprot:15780638-Heterocapsa_arctica.AAC.1
MGIGRLSVGVARKPHWVCTSLLRGVTSFTPTAAGTRIVLWSRWRQTRGASYTMARSGSPQRH